MLSFFILGVALLVGVLLLARWYVGADPKLVLKALKWAGLAVAMVVIAWLALTGKLWAALAALPAALAWFVRLATGLRYMQMLRRLVGLGGAGPGWSTPGAGGAGNGQSGAGSGVRTRYVFMHLNHATGHVWGEVLDGRFTGRALDDLTLDEVRELLAEAQGDPDSARLVESYLERRDPQWRARGPESGAAPQPSAAMTRAEALKILGLKEGAGEDEIKARHRHLMAQVHPDRGGSDYLAQQINRARDVLLHK